MSRGRQGEARVMGERSRLDLQIITQLPIHPSTHLPIHSLLLCLNLSQKHLPLFRMQGFTVEDKLDRLPKPRLVRCSRSAHTCLLVPISLLSAKLN